ncbi:MAG TPA: ABC transporter substrate-binding protein [Candidatus Binatia bacterium]
MNPSIALLASDSSHLPLLAVFQECGATQKYGFDLELDLVGSARAPKLADRSRLLLAGEVDFVSGLHHEPYLWRARGDKRLVYLAQTQNNWDDRLLVSGNIGALESLKGKKIICHCSAPCVRGNLAALLADHGFKKDEIRIEAIEDMSGSYRSYVDQVIAGAVDATLVDMPFDLYGRKGGLKILDLPDRPVIHNTTILTTTDYIKKNREKVTAFLKALIEAIHFFKTRPDDVARILKKNLSRRYGLEDEEYFVHLQQGWAKLLLAKPYPSPAAIHNVYELDAGKDPEMSRTAPLEPWDLHYLREIDDSGFIDRLYAV